MLLLATFAACAGVTSSFTRVNVRQLVIIDEDELPVAEFVGSQGRVPWSYDKLTAAVESCSTQRACARASVERSCDVTPHHVPASPSPRSRGPPQGAAPAFLARTEPPFFGTISLVARFRL